MTAKIVTHSYEPGSADRDPASRECYHCGEQCGKSRIHIDDHYFCCNGCKTVFQLLEEKDLCSYYDMNETPGRSMEASGAGTKFSYLDDDSIIQQLILHKDGAINTATLNTPTIHCSSCVYVLEKLYRLDPGIKQSEVDFLRKEVTFRYDENETSLRKVAELLTAMGYEPKISLNHLERDAKTSSSKDLYIKIGIAGFAFGNIMLISLPEYLSVQDKVDPGMQRFFSYLSLLLSLPVLLISARGYFSSAWMGIRQRLVNIDVPITLGIVTLFTRSAYEILSSSGTGYMDSFAALVFLLLLGKLFQQKTFDTLSFDRDYRSYFPISVIRRTGEGEEHIPLTRLGIGDRIVIRNEEIVPADAILIRSGASIDYSFVTGESAPVEKQAGDMIYAGGRQVGGAIELDVIKDVSQSYLTQLWNKDVYKKHAHSRLTTLTDTISKYFTVIVIMVATIAALFWLPSSTALALNAFTAVLIIACPCALALSSPFALGTVMRIFGKNEFYLKNVNVIESMAKIDAIVFDKTGTLTESGTSTATFVPADPMSGELSDNQFTMIASLARHSNHPLSQQVYAMYSHREVLRVTDFIEESGRGIRGTVNGHSLKLGSAEFLGVQADERAGTSAHIAIDGKVVGYFQFNNRYRKGLSEVVAELDPQYSLSLVSGDRDWERSHLTRYFPAENLHFQQSPYDKLQHISGLQDHGKHVLMMGDGLNDAGSLKQSNVGISISEDKNAFSPACDGILSAQSFDRFPAMLRLSGSAVRIVYVSFGISFLYNVIGLSFAVTGLLSPLISAILMPVSSISVVSFATLVTRAAAAKGGLGSKSLDKY